MKPFLFSVATLSLTVFLGSSALAQTTPPNMLLVTWHAETYAPLGYEGKTLITTGARVTFLVSAFTKGQYISLKDKNIRWYEQDKLKKSGIGLNSLETQVNLLPGNDFKMKVEVPDFPGGALSKTVSIRVVPPKVAIVAPFPNLQIPLKDFSVRAVPYFFSVFTENKLQYKWIVNDEPFINASDPQTVSVSGRELSASDVRSFTFRATAENPGVYVNKGEGIKTITVRTGQ
ncbi:MAG: hypothetical protein AAB691_02980 [Patescibacteria group bacterium]